MPRVTQEYRDARRQEIADAALRCFATHGFQATSMADIIAESHLSAGAIYGHFKSKQEIMIAVAQRTMNNRATELTDLGGLDSPPDPGTVLAVMVGGLATDLSGTKVLLQIWGEAVVSDEFRRVQSFAIDQLRGSLFDYFTAWARKTRGDSDAAARDWATAIVPVALGIAQGYIVQSALFPDFDADAYLASARDLLPH